MLICPQQSPLAWRALGAHPRTGQVLGQSWVVLHSRLMSFQPSGEAAKLKGIYVTGCKCWNKATGSGAPLGSGQGTEGSGCAAGGPGRAWGCLPPRSPVPSSELLPCTWVSPSSAAIVRSSHSRPSEFLTDRKSGYYLRFLPQCRASAGRRR